MSDTKLLDAGAAHPVRTKLNIWIYAWSVREGCHLTAITIILHVNLYPLEEGVHHTLTIDAQPGQLVTTLNLILTKKYVVLATVPNWRLSSKSGLAANWNHCNGFYLIMKPSRTKLGVFKVVPQCHKLRCLAPIKYLSCNRITIWYICITWSFRCFFTYHSPICNPITIRCVVLKIA
jgi:hypothetical protein